MRIRDLAQARPRFGYERITVMLRREGWAVGRKRVHRLYCLEGLQLRMRRRRRKVISLHRGPTAAHQYWAMDFVYDQLVSGRPFRVLTVIDKWSRESILLEADISLNGRRLVEAFERLGPQHRFPGRSRWITARNSPGSPSRRMPQHARVRIDRGCAAKTGSLAQRLQPASTPRIAWPSDPERVRTERSGSNVKSAPTLVYVWKMGRRHCPETLAYVWIKFTGDRHPD
jgi:transposase InsO family protein